MPRSARHGCVLTGGRQLHRRLSARYIGSFLYLPPHYRSVSTACLLVRQPEERKRLTVIVDDDVLLAARPTLEVMS
jgi:hypothetical protein